MTVWLPGQTKELPAFLLSCLYIHPNAKTLCIEKLKKRKSQIGLYSAILATFSW